MKVAFDEDLNSDDIETLRKLLVKLRNPDTVTGTFAFTHGHLVTQPHQLHMKVKEKNASLKYAYHHCEFQSICLLIIFDNQLNYFKASLPQPDF
jgi:hypothetical protein